MKIVRVHNPSRLTATKRRSKKTMATRRRKRRRSASVGRPRRVSHKAVNPRRRRRRSRRRNPTVIVARRRSRRAVSAAPRRRRRHSRRRSNPSALHVGQILKNILYGTGGAIATRTAASLAQGFVPGAFAGNPLTGPVLQAVLAATLIRWGGGKFLGKSQGDVMMFGGFISAGLEAADKFLPNIQNQITGIVRAPVSVAPGVGQAQLAGMNDVYDVSSFDGLNDVYDVEQAAFNQFP